MTYAYLRTYVNIRLKITFPSKTEADEKDA